MRTPRCGFPAGQFAGFANPSVTRTWQDDDGDFNPDCELTIPTAQGTQAAAALPTASTSAAQSATLFGSNQFVGANFDPGIASGWGKRPSDWSFSVSVQQEIFPRASIEVGYHRRSFTMFTTGGVITDNLAVGPADLTRSPLPPRDTRLPAAAGTSRGAVEPHPGGVFAGPETC